MANASSSFTLPEDFPEHLREYSPVEILAVAHEARDMIGTPEQKLASMRQKHPDFWFRYPKLLEMSCEPGMDMGQLGFMLNMLSDVNKQHTTLDSADRLVHQRLADRFNVNSMQHQQHQQGEHSEGVSQGD
jgi:hypothetical protein